MRNVLIVLIVILSIIWLAPIAVEADSLVFGLLPWGDEIRPTGSILIGSNPIFDSDETTVEGWFKPYSYPTGVNQDDYRVIVWNGDGTGGHDPYWIMIDVNGHLRVRVHYHDPYVEEFIISENPIALNVWYHFALVNSLTETKLYIDGNLQPTVISGAGPFCKGTNYLAFGRSLWHWNPFDGLIDEIRIWSKPKTQQQINNYMWSGTMDGTENDLTAYWDFEPGADPLVLYDLSPNQIDGEIKGTEHSSDNAPSIPRANAGSDQMIFTEVTLDGSQSLDPDGMIETYDWQLLHREDSSYNRNAQSVNPTISNLVPGFYDVILTVTDDDGFTDIDEMIIAVIGIEGDFDFDGDVDGNDLGRFSENFGSQE